MSKLTNKLRLWCYHVIIAIDQLFNALTGGAADETFSSRCYRGAILAKEPKKRWRFWFRLVNTLFWDTEHCKTAYESEVKRKQYPPDFTQID